MLAPMTDLSALVDKLLRVEAFFASTAGNSDVVAAEAARERIRKRLLEMAARRPSK